MSSGEVFVLSDPWTDIGFRFFRYLFFFDLVNQNRDLAARKHFGGDAPHEKVFPTVISPEAM